MPTLHWIGKEAVVKHHKDVPYRLLEPVAALSCTPSPPTTPSPFKGEPAFGFPTSVGAKAPNAGVKGGGEGKSSQSLDTNTTTTQNLIVQGDNLHALKALLPRYAGQVKCIYIDPPYNTGNEGWVYNDNVNSPEIKRWLGEVVGKEGETLDRHDRWLCMMYPRLLLLKQFLREDGTIFISIDDNEVASLRLLMDEIFGSISFVVQFPWKKRTAKSDVPYSISQDYEWILCFAKKKFLAGLEHERKYYSTPDYPNDGWRLADLTKQTSADERPNSAFDMIDPKTGKIYPYNPKRVWAVSKDTFNKYYKNGKIVFPDDYEFLGGNIPAYRVFESEDKAKAFKKFGSEEAIKTISTQLPKEIGMSQDGNKDLVELFDSKIFSFPKPVTLIQHIVALINDKDALILDSFAGSGTTAHAVLKQNAEDGGNRRFILVEMDENIAQNVTAERVKRVAQGYNKANGEAVIGLGGGFQFCKLSTEPLFTALGQIRSDVTFAQLAEFVWFVETGTGFTGKANSPLIGVHQGRAIYLLYNGILKDKSVGGGNVLTQKVLDILPKHDGAKVIFGAANRLGASKLAREQIVFKQTPYALDV